MNASITILQRHYSTGHSPVQTAFIKINFRLFNFEKCCHVQCSLLGAQLRGTTDN